MICGGIQESEFGTQNPGFGWKEGIPITEEEPLFPLQCYPERFCFFRKILTVSIWSRRGAESAEKEGDKMPSLGSPRPLREAWVSRLSLWFRYAMSLRLGTFAF
jgi:hypothetical protein